MVMRAGGKRLAWSERHVVFFGRRSVSAIRGRSFGFGGRTWTGGFVAATTTTAIAATAGIEERKAFEDDLELALFLAGVFVLPLVELEAAFHEEWAAFFHVLADDLGLAAKGLHVNKRHLFLGLAGFALPGAVQSHADLGHRRAFGRVAQFRVAGQVAREDDFVEISHKAGD